MTNHDPATSRDADRPGEADPQVDDTDAAVAETEVAGAGPNAVADADPGTPDTDHAADDRTPGELLSALEQAERTSEEYLDHLRRERAAFENFRKRMQRERMDALDRGAEALVSNLLGVLDNFGFVLEAAEDSADDQLSKGAQMVHTELLSVLRQAGLEEVPGKGEPFDPTWHEAMMQVDAAEVLGEPVGHPVVHEVLRPGYRFKGRVLRAASVSVAQ